MKREEKREERKVIERKKGEKFKYIKEGNLSNVIRWGMK